MNRVHETFVTPVVETIPEPLFERLLEKYPRGKMPLADHCFYLIFETRFGKPFAIPDYVITNNQAPGWSSNKPKDCAPFCKLRLAPFRGSKIRQRLQSCNIIKITSAVGYVVWMRHPEYDKPWLYRFQMPDFKYGDTIEEAVEKLL